MNMAAAMMIPQTVILVCLLVTSSFFNVGFCLNTTTKDINTDMSALLALKAQLTIPNTILESNWSTSSSESVCSWIGVSCGASDRRVTGLNLSSMGLAGVLPPHLGNLSFLTNIQLYNNTFHGSIPSEIFDLRRLEYADLWGNQFTGHIPYNLFLAPSLRKVTLGNNFLSGSIPKTVDAKSNTSSPLQFIGLAFNNLTGELPDEEIFNHLPQLNIFTVSYNMLTGPIPSSLFRCRLLQILSLSYNEFGGSIPPEIRNLTLVTRLFLNDNKLTGVIPSEIGGLINSEYIYLQNNALTGAIPSEIGGLINSKYLNLGNNALTGEIPSSITNLTNLVMSSFDTNNLTGPIPQQFWNRLQSIQYLGFIDNHLSGALPPNLFNVSSLVILGLSLNQFSGSLSPSIGLNLPNLQELHIGANLLSGAIPASLFNLSNLVKLEMSENYFSGPIPNELGSLRLLEWANFYSNNLTMISSSDFFTSLANCKSLKTLQLSSNPLNNVLSSSIGNLSTTLEGLHLESCQLKGTIPLQIRNLENLIILSLDTNRLSGTIPATVGLLQNLQYFSLAENKLEGLIPHDICKLSRMNYIYLDRNALNGSIPACLGNLLSLRKLTMSNNELSMEVPSSLWNLKDVQELDLSGNSLSGLLPREIGNLKVATWLSLSHNQFTGSIPPTLGSLINLQNLSFASNKLDGFIPESLGDLISLKYLDLSSNNLSGVIPKALEKLSILEYFNVSVNRLEGEIPDGGPFANFSAQSFILNGDLCGSARFEVSRCKTVAPWKNKSHKALIMKYAIISVVSIVVFGLLVLVLILVRYRKMNNVAENVTEMVPMTTRRRLSYYELVQATHQFHESNLLGAGAFGSVFKGTLSDGMDIAVKVFNHNMREAFESFHNECEVLRSIRHMNLVKVITSCSSPDFKCLIMEYMSNGSLENWLYGTDNLNIFQRLSIMIDVAKALEYLHHGYFVPVIHCDLKPSNVLLDEDMVAHVTDFGISKLLTGGDSITQTLTIATFGYTAPEYGLEGIVSIRGDVYSYGIMLMETFTGKRPTDEIFPAGMSLPQWVKKSLPYNVQEVVDFGLVDIEDKNFEKKIGCISKIMDLALECCSEKREDRPSITEVSTELKNLHAMLLHDPMFIP